MSILEEKKIVIRLPQLHWNLFLGTRFLAFLGALILSSGFAYWYHAVRPYLSIPSARLEAFSAVLSSDAAGRISEMGPAEGDFIKKGQMLFAFDRDVLLARKTQARNVLDQLYEQIEKEKMQIGKAMESYLHATTELDLGIGSSELVRKQLALMDESQSKADEARSRLSAAQTELDFADLQLKKMMLTAPFDGVILKRFENPGAVVSFGSPVYLLCDRDRLWVEVQVPESEISRISIGTPARIKLAAYPKKEFSGKVTYISPSTVSKSSSAPILGGKEKVSVKVSLENSAIALQPGLTAAVSLKVR